MTHEETKNLEQQLGMLPNYFKQLAVYSYNIETKSHHWTLGNITLTQSVTYQIFKH